MKKIASKSLVAGALSATLLLTSTPSNAAYCGACGESGCIALIGAAAVAADALVAMSIYYNQQRLTSAIKVQTKQKSMQGTEISRAATRTQESVAAAEAAGRAQERVTTASHNWTRLPAMQGGSERLYPIHNARKCNTKRQQRHTKICGSAGEVC